MTGGGIRTGWSVGAGLEWALSPQWSAKAEYAYFDFGRVGLSGISSTGDRYFQNVGQAAHTVKAGVNFRFGGAIR
jgi:outer membrane immunogenic protein